MNGVGPAAQTLAKVAKLLASLDPGQMQRRLPAKASADRRDRRWRISLGWTFLG